MPAPSEDRAQSSGSNHQHGDSETVGTRPQTTSNQQVETGVFRVPPPGFGVGPVGIMWTAECNPFGDHYNKSHGLKPAAQKARWEAFFGQESYESDDDDDVGNNISGTAEADGSSSNAGADGGTARPLLGVDSHADPGADGDIDTMEGTTEADTSFSNASAADAEEGPQPEDTDYGLVASSPFFHHNRRTTHVAAEPVHAMRQPSSSVHGPNGTPKKPTAGQRTGHPFDRKSSSHHLSSNRHIFSSYQRAAGKGKIAKVSSHSSLQAAAIRKSLDTMGRSSAADAATSPFVLLRSKSVSALRQQNGSEEQVAPQKPHPLFGSGARGGFGMATGPVEAWKSTGPAFPLTSQAQAEGVSDSGERMPPHATRIDSAGRAPASTKRVAALHRHTPYPKQRPRRELGVIPELKPLPTVKSGLEMTWPEIKFGSDGSTARAEQLAFELYNNSRAAGPGARANADEGGKVASSALPVPKASAVGEFELTADMAIARDTPRQRSISISTFNPTASEQDLLDRLNEIADEQKPVPSAGGPTNRSQEPTVGPTAQASGNHLPEAPITPAETAAGDLPLGGDSPTSGNDKQHVPAASARASPEDTGNPAPNLPEVPRHDPRLTTLPPVPCHAPGTGSPASALPQGQRDNTAAHGAPGTPQTPLPPAPRHAPRGTASGPPQPFGAPADTISQSAALPLPTPTPASSFLNSPRPAPSRDQLCSELVQVVQHLSMLDAAVHEDFLPRFLELGASARNEAGDAFAAQKSALVRDVIAWCARKGGVDRKGVVDRIVEGGSEALRRWVSERVAREAEVHVLDRLVNVEMAVMEVKRLRDGQVGGGMVAMEEAEENLFLTRAALLGTVFYLCGGRLERFQ